MTLFGIRIRIRLLSPVVFLLMIAFSGVQAVCPPLAALSVHELAHIIAAVLLHAKIDEIELMPFGAAMRLYDLWRISPSKLMIISLAGPAANLIVCGFLSLLLFFFPYLSKSVSPFLYSGLLIAFFNLLPALPLDGGRFLSALLALKVKRSKAIQTGINLGRILGIILAFSSFYVFFKTRTFPLPPVLASVYLFASAEQEKRHAQGSVVRSLVMDNFPSPPVARAGVIVVHKGVPLLEAVNAVRPGEESLFAIADDEGEILTLLPLKKILYALHENSAAAAEALMNERNKKIFESGE